MCKANFFPLSIVNVDSDYLLLVYRAFCCCFFVCLDVTFF